MNFHPAASVLALTVLAALVRFDHAYDRLSTEVFDYCTVGTSARLRGVVKLFEKNFRKRYASAEEKAKRTKCVAEKIMGLTRRCQMKKRTKVKPTYSLTLNLFADLTTEEYHKYLGYVPPRFLLINNRRRRRRRSPPSIYSNTTSSALLRPEVDWRNEGCISAIQMQGACGSCWAFAAVSVIESHYFLKVNKSYPMSLSVQNLVDCSQAQGNQGCDGGAMENAYSYIIGNNGINLASTYPYTAAQNPQCNFQRIDFTSMSSIISGWSIVEPYNEEALMQAIDMVGPVAAAIDASSLEFQLYKTGVLCHLSCSKLEVNHGVLIVGYKTVDNIPVWIIKNSWSTKWGMNGYCYVCRNTNFCGITTTANFPVLTNTV